MINSVTVMGCLTADPVMKEAGGTQICSFSIAVEEVRKDEKYTSFLECVLFGKSVAAFCDYMAKGRKVCVQGRLRQDRWKDKETGGNRSKIAIVVDQWQMADSKPAAKSQQAQTDSAVPSIDEENPF